jgi:hypothetical protein
MSQRTVRPGELLRLAVIALFFLAAPTAGDIGSCSQTASDLDAQKFFDAKQNLDCDRCLKCGIVSNACTTACGPTLQQAFPPHCYPVVHDGEVCLDALEVASCTDYQSYMADEDATIPTECNFCPPRPPTMGPQAAPNPEPASPAPVVDAGADQ